MSISEHKHMSEVARRIEVFTGAGRRRSWSAAEKASIVAESYGGNETVCGVARRYGLTPQQLFTWRRQARMPISTEDATPDLFVPAVVEPMPPEPTQSLTPKVGRKSPASGIELEIDGVIVRVGTGARPAAIAAVIRALKAGS